MQFCISTSHGTPGRPFGTIWDRGGHWGPLWARKQPKHASNHQIFLCPHFLQLTPIFPTVRLSQSKIFHLYFSWNTGSSTQDPQGPWGPWGAPLIKKMTKACLKSSDISLTTFYRTNTQFPIVKSSHSAILYLDFSWNTRLSIRDHWGPLGPWNGPLGAPLSQKTTKTCLKS